MPLDARDVETGDESPNNSYWSATSALKAAEEIIRSTGADDPVTDFRRYMEDLVDQAESNGADRAQLVDHLRSLLESAARGGDA